MTATDLSTRTRQGQAFAGDALVFAAIAIIGAGYAAACGWWAAVAVIAALAVGAWFVLRACARKVSGWNAEAADEQATGVKP